MSELIQKHDNRATIRWKLLTSASALALTAYVSSTALAKAEDTDRPQIWIELGGDMDMMQGLSSPFTAPFMFVTPTPKVYGTTSFARDQAAPRFAFGGDAKITFQPEDSDWIFSAGIRYGRSHAKRNAHHQSNPPPITVFGYPSTDFDVESERAVSALTSERHMVLDFSAGKDVGIGAFGHDGTSTISAGIRMLDIKESSTVSIFARPKVHFFLKPPKYNQTSVTIPAQYMLTGHATRSFKGIGPSLSWSASAAFAGNSQDGELMLDWGIDASMLFGRQKAKTDHTTNGVHHPHSRGSYFQLPAYTAPHVHHSTRSRSVAVPNVGGFMGISLKYPNAKVSLGYRADIFFNAFDGGIDSVTNQNVTFNGPYASISIGLGSSDN